VRRLAIVAAVVIVAALATPASAAACSCAPVEPKDAMRSADAAIVGRLIEVVPRGDLAADFRYRVQRVYKSDRGLTKGRIVAVRSNVQGAACGLPSGDNRRYGLFLDRREGRWTGNLCAVFEPKAGLSKYCDS